MEQLVDDLEALKSDKFAFPKSSLQEECERLYQDMNTSISSFICDLSPNEDLPKLRSGFSQLSQSWARRLFGSDMSVLLTHAHKAEIPKCKVVAAVITAGIFELVFESEFPEMLSIESPFFTEFRRLVSISGGRSKSRNIELAAIKSVFANDEVKKKLIHEKAK
ncbi:uncharacterized protein BKA55DRAFT_690597 [Fusarium redolens]|uniref:Uncharacterized protein n=1 Tax=Fusarium redolens TaxID=48865 RepID=A0A9P9KAQ2_FUSRE|nr:uncharacterized protein BKA55DRAFT_690597 [Fusarium redolens]KAH7250365.1 hypothetical protein BKA55DRAFT_690597 [Fusarium redolens]